MLSLRKINPMARAVGTMGIVATMVGAVTFANLTSNTVALSPNNLVTATAHLQIGNAGCADLSDTSVPGFSTTNYSVSNPGSKTFCLNNDGDVALLIGATVAANAGALEGSPAAQNTTLTIQCGADPAVSGTLNTSWATAFPTALAAGQAETCVATATLSPSYTGTGGETVPLFDINFVGTEPTPVVPAA